MKYFCSALLVGMAIFGKDICQLEKGSFNAGQSTSVKRCADNPDTTYSRQRLLEQLAQILNQSIPEYRQVFTEGFSVQDERGVGFFVYDLTDTSNKGTPLYNCVDFRNNHIYHFAPIRHHYSLSHIVILEDGKLKVFRTINCEDRGDSLKDVVMYLEQKLVSDKNKEEIINRVKDYRKFGIYLTVDDTSLVCKTTKNAK